MRTAADIMTREPKMIASGDTLVDVIRLFLQQGITSSPVINPIGEILGVLTELTLVKAFIVHKAKGTQGDKVGHFIDLFEKVSYIDDSMLISDIMKSMIASPTHRLLVRDSGQKIIGIISPKDVMKAIIGYGEQSQSLGERLIEAEKKLRESLHKLNDIQKHLDIYKNIFHEVPYVMHAIDEKGIIIMSNKREHDMLGYKDGELIGKSIYDLYAEPMHDAATRGLKTIKEGGHQAVTYTSLKHINGTVIRCDIASSALRDKNGNFLSTISVLRPVDSDELLRILNGIVSDGDSSLRKYVDLLKKG